MPVHPVSAAAAERAPGLPLVRLAATFAACAAFLYSGHIPLPMVNLAAFVRDGGVPRGLSVAALGLVPIVAAYVVVELASALVPRWERLRQVPGRPQLERASTVLAVAFALLQGLGLARYLDTVTADYEPALTVRGPGFFLVLTLTLAAGSCLALALVRFIDQRGIGRGMSMLFAAAGLEEVPRLVEQFQRGELGAGAAVGIFAAVGGTVLVLGSRRGPLRVPVCGLDPVLRASMYVLALGLSGVLPRFAPALATGPGLWAVRLGLVVTLAVWFSRAFTAGEDEGRRAALPGAIARSLVYLVAMSVLMAGIPAVDLLGLVTVAAVAMDLAVELRLYAAHGELVAIRREQKPDRADDVVEALRERGIPAVAQAAFHRTLLHFFGPFVPVDVLVPASRAGEAIADEQASGRAPA